MNISELIESDLLSFTLDHRNLYIEFFVLSVHNQKFKISAHNVDASPITVNFIGLNISAGFDNSEGFPSLGEIESISESGLGFCFEGDMGIIEVKANSYVVEKIL